ncbi:MAG TPA: hypothetical protein VNT32_04205, partial [Thermoleophilaceae bacterium]|nr:hypothetical protein [Thermoleophilaceae bacterium]
VVIDADTGQRHLIWTEIDSNPPDPANRTLIIRPAKNFLEGHRYIVALRGMKDAGGGAIEPSAAFRSFRDNPAPGARGRRGQMEDIFARLDLAGIERESLYLAWDFTVASADSLAGRMLSIRDRAFAELGDTNLGDLTVQGSAPAFRVTSVTENPDPRLARIVEGTVDVPCFLSGGANCAPGNRFVIGPDGDPVRAVRGKVEANFRCNIPRSATDGPGAVRARASLYGHGLFGSTGELNQGQLKQLGNERNFVFCGTDWDGMSSEDLPVTAGLIIPDLSNFGMLADRVQQGMLNFLVLGRAMIHPGGFSSDPAFQSEGESVLDTSRLFYDGNSQGGIIGGALTAVAVDHERAVLGVPGMNYSTLLQRSSDFVGPTPLELVQNQSTAYGFSTFVYTTYPDERERQLVFSVMQLLWDRAEANGYAQHMTSEPLPNTPAHKVLMHVALGDHQVAPVTTEVEARTIGARVLNDPLVAAGRHSDSDPFYDIAPMPGDDWDGSVLVWWDSGSPIPPITNTANHSGKDPHEHPRRQAAARLQKHHFLRTGGSVVDVCGDAPCIADPAVSP